VDRRNCCVFGRVGEEPGLFEEERNERLMIGLAALSETVTVSAADGALGAAMEAQKIRARGDKNGQIGDGVERVAATGRPRGCWAKESTTAGERETEHGIAFRHIVIPLDLAA